MRTSAIADAALARTMSSRGRHLLNEARKAETLLKTVPADETTPSRRGGTPVDAATKLTKGP